MGAKVLGVAFLAGLSLLSAYVSAHGDEEHPPSCTIGQFNVCFVGFIQNNILVPMTTFTRNQTAEQNAYVEQLRRNPEHYKMLCDAWKDSIDCLRPLEEACEVGTEYESFNEVFPDLPSDIDLVQTQYAEWQMGCSSAMMCWIKADYCAREYPVDDNPDLTDSDVCMKLKQLYECWNSESHCRAYANMTKTLTETKKGVIQCESTLQCPAMVQCYTAFISTPPKEEGLNEPTCFAYRDYTECAQDTIGNCSDVDALAGGIKGSPVTSYVTQACTAMGQDGINAVYDCDNFTQCIARELDAETYGYPEYFCRTTQAVMSCGFHAVKDWCALNVSTATKEAFLSHIKELMLDAQAEGCGMAHFSGMACDGVQGCAMTAFYSMYDEDEGDHDNGEEEGDDYDSNIFNVKCMEIRNFTSCADSKVKMCGLHGPQTMPYGGVAVPMLDDLSDTVMDICTVMGHTELSRCPELFYCLDSMKSAAEDEFLIMNGHAWCGYLVHVMECADSLTLTCKKTNAQKTRIAEIYDDLINLGCANPYDHEMETPERTTPTSGALPQIAVGWMGMLLPLLFCWIM